MGANWVHCKRFAVWRASMRFVLGQIPDHSWSVLCAMLKVTLFESVLVRLNAQKNGRWPVPDAECFQFQTPIPNSVTPTASIQAGFRTDAHFRPTYAPIGLKSHHTHRQSRRCCPATADSRNHHRLQYGPHEMGTRARSQLSSQKRPDHSAIEAPDLPSTQS